MKRFTFGAVPSRRLGFSLGVDIIPKKFCSFDCIYCQVGKTTNHDIKRKGFYDIQEVVSEVVRVTKNLKNIDVITFSGSGEPTLNADIGVMIKEIKRQIDIPVSVITNSSLLYDEKVREEISSADIILPSLDAASEDIFHYINRPHSDIKLNTIIDGLKALRDTYKGKIWLEVMMIKDINDDLEELEKFKKIINVLNVDKVQLNTVTRPPVDNSIKSMTQDELERICRYFGNNCEIVCSFKKAVTEREGKEDSAETILSMINRRSLTLDDILSVTGLSLDETKNILKLMEKQGKIKSFYFADNIYYMPNIQ